MNIYLMTDLEGVAGVVNFRDYCDTDSRCYALATRLLTHEVNAAIEGFFDAGADAVTVVDGHGAGAIDIELLDARARYERGIHSPIYPWGLDEGYDAFAIVGQHAKSGTPYSHLTHTGCPRCYDLTVTGFSIGEYGSLALCAMELGIPSIFAAGEEAFCREAEILTPGVITAAVKRGLLPDAHEWGLTGEQYENSKLSANHMSPVAARTLIRKQAALAVATLKKAPQTFSYRHFEPPYHVIREYRASQKDNEGPFYLEVENAPSVADGLNGLQTAERKWGRRLPPLNS